MLVLERRIDEEIMIGSAIRLVVLKVAHGKVKLGVAAPSDVTIYREEICRHDLETATTASEPDRGQPCSSGEKGKRMN